MAELERTAQYGFTVLLLTPHSPSSQDYQACAAWRGLYNENDIAFMEEGLFVGMEFEIVSVCIVCSLVGWCFCRFGSFVFHLSYDDFVSLLFFEGLLRSA